MECDEDLDTTHIRVLPDICVEIFINYTSSPIAVIDKELYSSSIINSRMSKPMDVQMRRGSGCIAICFYPGMAYRFFPQPINLLSDRTMELFELWNHLGNELEDKLENAQDNVHRAAIVQQYLLTLLKKSKEDILMDDCLRLINSSADIVSVKQLIEATGTSQRHLSRKFQETIGMSPKEYLRVKRFLRSLNYLKGRPAPSLTRIVYQSGYYDQSHFIRDYKSYSGLTPAQVISSSNILY